MILLTTLGSHGDLNPYVALGLALKRRGHRVRIATTEFHRPRIEPLGLEFHALRPNLSPADRNIVEGTMDPRHGPEFLLREIIFPHLRQTFEDTVEAARGADLIVSHMITFGTVLAAETSGRPWASTVLAPLSMASAYDPPVVNGYPWMSCLHALGPTANRAVVSALRRYSSKWFEPYQRLRKELGLGRGQNPVFEGQHSPHLALILFSSLLGAPQSDWPTSALQTGFLFHDETTLKLSSELERFFDQGEPPIVFTLGTAAVHVAGDFYAQSALAARKLGRRAVFLIGKDAGNSREGLEGPGLCVAGYEPYARVFERAGVIVHQGGIGTTAQALRSGRPMLIVPFGNDQSDNAARVARLGAARTIDRSEYTWRRAAYELGELLADKRYAERSTVAKRQLDAEPAEKRAVDALERLMTKTTTNARA